MFISSAIVINPIVGIANKKLTRAASFPFNPKNKPAVIVIHDLEVPGIKAKH